MGGWQNEVTKQAKQASSTLCWFAGAALQWLVSSLGTQACGPAGMDRRTVPEHSAWTPGVLSTPCTPLRRPRDRFPHHVLRNLPGTFMVPR